MAKIPRIEFIEPIGDIKIETFTVPSTGCTGAKPVRAYIKDDVLIQEFEIVDGPRKGQILTLRTKMIP